MKGLGLRWWTICLLLLVQDAVAAPPQWAFRIAFADKAGSPALSNPNAFLSTRALQRRTQQGIVVSDEDRPVSPDYVDSVLRISGGKMHNTSRWFNQCVILVTDTTSIAAIRTKPFVTTVSLVAYFANGLHKGNPGEGKDIGTSTSSIAAHKGTGSAAYYGSAWDQTTMVNGDALHDLGYTGAGQLIAVLDLGFNGTDTHPGFDSLRAQGRLIDQYNFVIASPNIYNTVWSHGTSSLSTMAGLNPGTFVGSAPHAQYALYLTDDNSISDAVYELDNFVAGVERADSIGADIITSSLGYNTFVNPAPAIYDFTKAQLDGHTTIVARAMNMATARGIFTVASAGNEGGNSWNFLLTPGDADSALTGGAVNATRTIAGFSSPGPNSSGRVKPDVCTLGDPAAVFGSVGVTSGSGTSFSTPQLAGWAACIRQFRPTITPYELRNAIIQSADRASNPNAAGGYGYGIPNFRRALQLVGVPQIAGNDAGIGISPNPFTDRVSLTISIEKPSPVVCSLIDMMGRVLATQTFNARSGTQELAFTVPSKLPAGNYLLKTVSGGKTSTNKLSKR